MNRILELLSPYEKNATVFEKEPSADQQNTRTKIGGTPWWPEDVERPKDAKGRSMKFVAQINLDDIDFIDLSDAILSFHYSVEDMHEGNMSFGGEEGSDDAKGYDVRVLTNISNRVADGNSEVDETFYLSSKVVKLVPTPGEEVLLALEEQVDNEIDEDESYELWDEAIAHYFEEFEEGESHIGGYPQWVQDPEYPANDNGDDYQFVAYIDGSLLDAVESYLFIDTSDDKNPKAAFVCQTT